MGSKVEHAIRGSMPRFKWFWAGAVAGVSGLATAVVVYYQSSLTVGIFVITIGIILTFGGFVVGLKWAQRGDGPFLAAVGALALSSSVTAVGLFQPASSACGGDCEQGGGLGFIVILLTSFLIFLVTIGAGTVYSQRKY